MPDEYTWLPALADAVALVEGSTVSRVLLNNEQLRVTGFAMDAGQALTEHAASAPAWIQFLGGEISFTVGGESVDARPGSAVYLSPGTPHSLVANTAARFLLILIKKG